jgi:hypothetical protein
LKGRFAAPPSRRRAQFQTEIGFIFWRIEAKKGRIGFVRSEMTSSFDHAQ